MTSRGDDAQQATDFRFFQFQSGQQGEYIIVIYESVNNDTAYPVTAYHVPEP